VALRQQQVGTLLAMSAATVSGQVANPGLLVQLQQSSAALRQAQLQVAQAESAARNLGGTTSASSGAYIGIDDGTKLGQAIKIAAAQIGKPYVWGAESPSEGGFDCSGLIDYAFRKAGIPIPGGRLTTQSAIRLGVSVKGKPYQPGDWIFTNGGKHMVMYVGGGQVIAAPHSGEVVQYQPLSQFEGQIVDVRRLLSDRRA
jgi:cell wall-associated NlpC family hydrolase